MRKSRKEILISKEDINIILNYSKVHSVSFSEGIRNLAFKGLEETTTDETIEKLFDKIEKINFKIDRNFQLLIQIYSDLNLTNITNPKSSKPVKEFIRKMRISQFDE